MVRSARPNQLLFRPLALFSLIVFMNLLLKTVLGEQRLGTLPKK
jgi:hypothetical protein